MRYRLLIAYVGTGWAGWQRQTNAPAIQQAVEEALARIVRRCRTVHGAGRTDAGVHALGQVAHVDLARLDLPRGTIRRALVHGTNRHLPASVRVLEASPVDAAFHARYSAVGKTYVYRLSAAPVIDPFRAPFVVPAPGNLDLDAMQAATAQFPGEHDFTAFARSGGTYRSPVRRIDEATWTRHGDELRFRVRGAGFLRGMVRAMVGTSLEVGRGRRTPDEVSGLLAGRPRTEAGPNAPARGLCLEAVQYDDAQ